MRPRWLAAPAIGAGLIVAVVVLNPGGGSSDDAVADPAASTALVERRDLVETDTEDGTLGYADTRTIANRLPGIVTWLPPAGRRIRSDGVLYKVDQAPVILMSGRVPAYRRLGAGVSAGGDVKQLERSLRAAGYDRERDMKADGVWDAATTAAVRRWQDAHGLPPSGTIEPGRVVFLPGVRRVATVPATLGAPPRGPVLTTTSLRRRVSVALDTAKSELAQKNARVKVVLPSDEEVGGRITSVGKVATRSPAQEGDASSADVDATIEVKIRLSRAATRLDQAPVTVRFEESRRKDVLAIPVTALLARPGGSFAVQLVRPGGNRRVVEVKAGLYAGGYVEIAGVGLRPGTRVTNAAVQ